jgi:hypothetical protein
MALTWKDLITTLLAGGTVATYFAYVNSTGGYRIPVLILAIIGIAMCAFSGGVGTTTGGTNPYIVVASILGVAALILIVYGLITGAKIAFVLLAGTMLLLWIVATLRHALNA